jgi:hypothetical protein
MRGADDSKPTADRRAWRAWDARLAAEVRRMAVELKASAPDPRPVKGVRQRCPV